MKILKFYADWCGHCKVQAKLLENYPIEVQSIDVEDDANESLVGKYGIRNLPALIVLDDNEQIVKRFTGLTTLEKLNEVINSE